MITGDGDAVAAEGWAVGLSGDSQAPLRRARSRSATRTIATAARATRVASTAGTQRTLPSRTTYTPRGHVTPPKPPPTPVSDFSETPSPPPPPPAVQATGTIRQPSA